MDDPRKGSFTFVFDPRCLGLRTYLLVGSAIEDCLAYGNAKSIELVGKEAVEGIAAWHVRVKSRYDESLDFWIEATRPDRLIKHTYGDDTVISKFDETNAIPVEGRVTQYKHSVI